MHPIWPYFYPILSVEDGVSMAYWLGAFTFVILIPYMRNTINLLNPSTILDRLTVKITKDTLFESNDDPIQPIMDIVHGSIMRYDLATTRFGLKTLTDQIVGLIDTELAADDDHEAEVTMLDERFCIPVAFAGKLAVSREDEESTLEVIANLWRFGESVVKKVTDEFAELEGAAWRAAYSLGVVGRAAAEKELGDTSEQAAVFFGALGRAAADKELGDAACRAADSLGVVGYAAAEKKLGDAAWQAADSLGVVGYAAAEKKLEGAAWQAVDSLLYFGVATLKSGLQKSATEAAKSLAALAVVKKEIVDIAIHEFKSKIETEEDRKAFGEFMVLFNKELEELRKETEKQKN
jgi:hypothetical protein